MAEPKVLLSDVVLGESLRWHDGRLWFSDWGTGQILRLEGDAKNVVATLDAMPFCIDWLPDGRMISTNGGNQRLLRQEPDGSLVAHADLTGIAGPYPWNDIAADSRGYAFINNVGFDFPGGEPKPGLIAVVTPDARRVRSPTA